MSDVFGAGYASAYDALYTDKDYDADCRLIETIVKEHNPSADRILDLGCGTGAHSIRLVQSGWTVTGVDRSSAMLKQAELKARSLDDPSAVVFHQADLLGLDLGKTFDAALMMFAVLGYQHENEQVLAALRTARNHLDEGGLLLFDVWYGPAVLRERPSERIKSVRDGESEILRVTSGELDTSRHLCTVSYQLWRLEGERLVERTSERHAVRYFFPLELELFLEQAGFSLVQMSGLPDFPTEPDETTWNVMVVAARRES